MSDFFLLLMHLNITTAQGSTEACPAVLDPPPELSSIRTSPPSASPQSSIALDDTLYPADLHSTPSASHSPSDATSVLSAQDSGLFLGNDALRNAHSTPGTNSAHQQSLLPLKSLPLDPDLTPQPPSETNLAVAQLDPSKGEDSTEGTDTSTADFATAKVGSEPHGTEPGSPRRSSQSACGTNQTGPGSPIRDSPPACGTDQPPETDAEEQGTGSEQAARHSQSPRAALTHLANPQADSDAWAGNGLAPTSSLGDSANAQTAAAGSNSSPQAGSAGTCKPQEGSDPDTGTKPVPAASPGTSVSPQEGSEADMRIEAMPGTSFTASASPEVAAEMGMGTEAVPRTSLSSSDSPHIQRQGSNAEASTRGMDDTELGNSPRKHRLAVQAGQSRHCCMAWLMAKFAQCGLHS